jgi:hypothetical protein
VVTEGLATGQIQAGGRLIEQQQLRSVIRARAIWTRLRSRLAEGAEGAIRESGDAQLGRVAHGSSHGRDSSYCSRHRPTTAYEAGDHDIMNALPPDAFRHALPR